MPPRPPPRRQRGSIAVLIPVLAAVAGIAAAYALFSGDEDRPERHHEPDEPLPPLPPPLPDGGPPARPNKTGFKAGDRILDRLTAASASSRVPLGLLVGWVAKESGGRLATKPQPGPGDTKLDERGYFQLMPVETKALATTDPRFADHERLSTDSDYSINAGLALVGRYAGFVTRLGVAPYGSAYFWKMTKLCHSMGTGQTAKIVKSAKVVGKTGSWEALENFALGMNINGPQPKKWFPLVDEVYAVGRPFGFGTERTLVAGWGDDKPKFIYSDIVDPLDVIAPRP